MRWILATALFLAAALVWYLLIGKGLPYSTYTREYKAKDPVRDAAMAWSIGDRRFKGVHSDGLDAPGVPEWYYTFRFGIDAICGTSDSFRCSEARDFQHVAWDYAQRYNEEILRRLRVTPSTKAAATVALIQKQGGKVAVLDAEIAAATLPLRTLKDAALREALRGLGDIDLLRISADIPCHDADLDLVVDLPNLTDLDLSSSPITDAGLAGLNPLLRLTTLSLHDTGVTDQGMEGLRGLQKLEQLYLGHTRVTDQGLLSVGKLEKLRELTLSEGCSDVGLNHLTGLKHLRYLGVQFTKVTPAGMAELRKTFPQLMSSGP